MYETPLTELTEKQLNDHYSQLLARESAVIDEQNRRRALPFIWQNESQIVQSLRAAGISATPDKGEDYIKPTSIVTAYIAGDEVVYEDTLYEAHGEGAIMHEPGVENPIMGHRWNEVTDA